MKEGSEEPDVPESGRLLLDAQKGLQLVDGEAGGGELLVLGD